MAFMAIKNQQLIFSNCTGMSMLMEYFFNLKQAKLIIYSVIFTDLNYPVRWYIFIL